MKPKPKILIADSEVSNIKLLEGYLAPHGFDIVTASGGEEVLKIIGQDQVDLVVLGAKMPPIDGIEVTKRLRAKEETSLMPIILTGPSEDASERKKGIEAKCDDFISRPFDQTDVITRVGTLLKISYYRPLLNEREKFEYVLTHITEDGIVMFDKNLNVTHLNQRARDLFKIGPNDLPLDFLGYIKASYKIHYDGDIKSDIKSKSISFDIERPQTETVKPLILSARITAVKNPLGEISNIVMMFNDITEKRQEEFLKQSFLGLISHKLRTPVVVISQSAAMLNEGILGTLNDDQKKVVGGMLEKSYSLTQLVEKLLGFTTITNILTLKG